MLQFVIHVIYILKFLLRNFHDLLCNVLSRTQQKFYSVAILIRWAIIIIIIIIIMLLLLLCYIHTHQLIMLSNGRSVKVQPS
jgi:hypothetical protein